MVYVSENKGPWTRERPVVRWKDRVRAYIQEKGADRGERLELTRGSVWIGRDEGSSVVAIPLGYVLGGNEASEILDR